MREKRGLRAWLKDAVITICIVVVAAAGALTIWRATQPASLPDASCGTSATHNLGGVTQILSDDAGALGCFSAAARACKPASLEVTEIGVDAGAKYVFAIRRSSSPCLLTELSQSYGYAGGSLSTGRIFSVPCRRTAVTAFGIMLSCARHDVLIPAAVTAAGARQASLPLPTCGDQVSVSHIDGSIRPRSGTDPGVLACFGKAARGCTPASIGMNVSPGHGLGTDYVFRIEAGGSSCPVTELSQAWGMNGAGWWSGILTSVPCRVVTVTGWGVRLSCAHQEVGIPAHI